MRDNYSDTTVIVPTLNEGGNIGRLILLLTKKYGGIRVMVSDDGSDDGTQGEVNRLHRKNGNITLLDRSQRQHGLAISVMEAAMKVKTPKIIVMDADLQHPVDKVGEMSRKLSDYEIVVGVRTYVKNWGWHRRLISKTMASTSYAVFKAKGKKTSNDMMSGFFGIRTRTFKGAMVAHPKGFVPHGYKILLDILRLVDSKTIVGEVTYASFHKRTRGKSKLSYRHIACTVKSTFK